MDNPTHNCSRQFVFASLVWHQSLGAATIHAETALADLKGEYGNFMLDSENQAIRVRLNAAYPGIRTAVLTRDEEKLRNWAARP